MVLALYACMLCAFEIVPQVSFQCDIILKYENITEEFNSLMKSNGLKLEWPEEHEMLGECQDLKPYMIDATDFSDAYRKCL